MQDVYDTLHAWIFRPLTNVLCIFADDSPLKSGGWTNKLHCVLALWSRNDSTWCFVQLAAEGAISLSAFCQAGQSAIAILIYGTNDAL